MEMFRTKSNFHPSNLTINQYQRYYLRANMECPVCLCAKSSKLMITLECNHKICLECAGKWLLKNPSCALCRKYTDIMRKNTRSRTKSRELLRRASMTWSVLSESMIVLLLTTQNEPDAQVIKNIIANFVLYIEIFFIKEHTNREWYRPEMTDFKNLMKNTTEQLFSQIPYAFTPPQTKIVKQFLTSV